MRLVQIKALKNMYKNTDLPASLRCVSPLLAAARILGIAPYTVTQHNRIVRSKFYSVITVLVLCGVVVVCVFWAVRTAEPSGSSRFYIFLSKISSFSHMGFSLSVIGAALKSNLKACDALVRGFSAAENAVGACIPRIVSRCRTLGILSFMIIANTINGIIWSVMFNYDVRDMVYYSFEICVAYVFCSLYFFLVLIVKSNFDKISNEISYQSTKLETHFHNSLSQRSANNEETRYARNVATNATSPCGGWSVPQCDDIVRRLTELQMAHAHVKEVSDSIEHIFNRPFVFYYALSLPAGLWGAYYSVLEGASARPAYQQLSLYVGLVLNLGPAALVAAVAGRAAAAGRESPLRGLAGLLARARGLRAVEARAKLFALQLRASPVAFTCGGLVPLNLGFFLGLVSTLTGYLFVYAQFDQQAATSGTVHCAANCSCCNG